MLWAVLITARRNMATGRQRRGGPPAAARLVLAHLRASFNKGGGMRSARIKALPVVVGATIATGCSLFGPDTCVGTALPGLYLSVVDSITMAPPAQPATLVITGVAYVDSLPRSGDQSFDGHTFLALYDLTGTYSLKVNVPGYAEWVRSNVFVDRNRCRGAVDVHLTAKVQPLGPLTN